MAQLEPPTAATTYTLPLNKLSPRDFERLCLRLVEREGWERAELLDATEGKGGCNIIAWREGRPWAFRCQQVQCFGPDDALPVIDAVLALPEGERPAGLIFLVTCEASPGTRQRAQGRCAGQIECYFGTGLDQRVQRHPDIVQEFFGSSSPAAPVLVTGETLQVVEGSTFLRDQEEQSHDQGSSLALVLFVLIVVAAFAVLTPTTSTAPAIALVIAALVLLGSVGRSRAGQENFALGRKGEEEVVSFLEGCLNGEWYLFRNVVLPGEEADVDGVLIGPRGIYALEVKAYTGYNRNIGGSWQRRLRGRWRTLDRNPTSQARWNAARLSAYLEERGVEAWVEPRVVWAGSGKLWLERPTVPVWQLSNHVRFLEDIGRGRTLHRYVVARTVAALEDIQAKLHVL